MSAEVGAKLRHRLLVRGQTDLDGNPLVGDELRQPLDVGGPIGDAPRRDLRFVEQPRPVADPVGVQVADRLEDRLGPVVFARVNGLAQERFVRHLVGHAVLLGGVSLLLARQVDADDEQPLVVLQPGGRARHLHAGGRVHFLGRCLGQRLEDPAVAFGELRRERPQRAQDDARDKARLPPRDNLRPGVVRGGGTPNPGIDGAHRAGEIQSGPDVQLRREPNLDVAHAFGLAVLAQLERRLLERFVILEYRDRVLESLEILAQVGVARPEDELPQPGFGVRRQGDAAPPGQIDQRAQPEGPVEMDVQVRLRQSANHLWRHSGHNNPGKAVVTCRGTRTRTSWLAS